MGVCLLLLVEAEEVGTGVGGVQCQTLFFCFVEWWSCCCGGGRGVVVLVVVVIVGCVEGSDGFGLAVLVRGRCGVVLWVERVRCVDLEFAGEFCGGGGLLS